MSLSAFSLLLTLTFLVSTVSASKCKALCFLNKEQQLGCGVTKLPKPRDLHRAVRCVRQEYGTSTEIVIGSSEDVDGLIPGGFDIFSHSEQKSSSVPIQLTLNVKIKKLGPNIFTNFTNLQRLHLRPLDVDTCAFYNLPPSVTGVLLQCNTLQNKMLTPMRWPSATAVQLKLNMCMQMSRCYSCTGSRSVELRSAMKRTFALNKIVSLTECVSASSCITDNKQCEPRMTTTTTAVTKKSEPNTPEPTAKAEEPKYKRTAPVSSRTLTEERELQEDEKRFLKGQKKENLLLLAVAGATVLNSLLLFIVLVILFYAASCCCCCRKRSRGVFFVSKENYPPEYSTLRPV